MNFIVLMGVILLVVSGPAEAMINLNPYSYRQMSKPASNALRSAIEVSKPASNALRFAIEATRPTVQLPLSANKFIDAVLAEACANCHQLGRLIGDLKFQKALTVDSPDELRQLKPELPPRIAKSYNDLLELYDALQSHQQLIDETDNNWKRELIRAENDNYLQLLTETETALNQMLDDLQKVVDEYGLEDIPDIDTGIAASLGAGGATLWGIEEESNALLRAHDQEKENRRYNVADDLALLGAVTLMSNNHSDDSPASSVYDHARDMEIGKAFADSLHGDGGLGGVGGNSILDDNGVNTAIDILDLLLF